MDIDKGNNETDFEGIYVNMQNQGFESDSMNSSQCSMSSSINQNSMNNSFNQNCMSDSFNQNSMTSSGFSSLSISCPVSDGHLSGVSGHTNGYGSYLNPYYSGFEKASSPARSTRSTQSSTGGRSLYMKKHRMHEGFHLPLDEFRMAATQGNLPVIKILVKQGIAVDQILKSGWTALMYASSCGKPHIVQYLLQQGATPNLHKELFTALMAACASSCSSEGNLLECVHHLLEFGANVNMVERHRMSALMFASKEGRLSLVQCLLDAKADVDKQDNKGWTAVCWAATRGHGRVVRLLLEHSADPNKMNTHGQKPADVALAAGHVEIAEILERISAGSKIENLSNILSDNKESEKLAPDVKSSSILYGELEMVLAGLDLQDLIPHFHKHQVTFEEFLRFRQEDLDRIGIYAVCVRKKILNAIKELNTKEWQPSSLRSLSQTPQISLPEAVAMVANISKHIRYIHASLGYLRDQIQDSPRILQLGQEVHTVSSLSRDCSDCLKCISALSEEVRFLKAHLDKVCDNCEHSPSDLIVECVDERKAWQRRLLAYLGAATSMAVVLWYVRPGIFASLFNLSTSSSTITLDL